MVYILTNSLDYKKEKILLFIKDNQGCTKQAVVDFADEGGISSRKTTMNVLKDLEEKKEIYSKKDKPNSRDFKLFLNHDNPIAELKAEINKIKETFDLLVDIIYKDNNLQSNKILNDEYDTRIEIISLLSCILKLTISIITEILVNYLSEKILDKDELANGYNYFHIKISEMHLSFDKLKTILDEKSLDHIFAFAKRNDSPFETFLWSVLIYYETMNNPYKLIFTKNFKKRLSFIMELIYNLGKRYSPSIYDEIVYEDNTYGPLYYRLKEGYNPKYTRQIRDELTKLDYTSFIRLLMDQVFLIDSLNNSYIVILLRKIKSKRKEAHPALWVRNSRIFGNIIENIIKNN